MRERSPTPSSQSSSYTSRQTTPEPPRSSRHHHHSESKHHERKSIKRIENPKSSSFMKHIYVFCAATFIQIVLSISKNDYKSKMKILRPKIHEQPLTGLINDLLDNKLYAIYLSDSFRLNLTPIFMVSLFITLTCNMISKNRAVVISFLISIMILFDEPTMESFRQNPASLVQFLCIIECLNAAQDLENLTIFTNKFFSKALKSWFYCSLSFMMRIEALPIAIPLLVQIEKSLNLSTKHNILVQLIKLIGIFIVLSVISSLGALVSFSIMYIFGEPKYEMNSVSYKVLFGELFAKPHNLSIFLLAPITLIIILVSDIDTKNVFAYFSTIVAILLLPITCVVDDLLIKVILCKYIFLIMCGCILSGIQYTKLMSILLFILVMIVAHTYFSPLQNDIMKFWKML